MYVCMYCMYVLVWSTFLWQNFKVSQNSLHKAALISLCIEKNHTKNWINLSSFRGRYDFNNFLMSAFLMKFWQCKLWAPSQWNDALAQLQEIKDGNMQAGVLCCQGQILRQVCWESTHFLYWDGNYSRHCGDKRNCWPNCSYCNRIRKLLAVP